MPANGTWDLIRRLKVNEYVVARSKAWVCDRSLAGIAGSNSVGGMEVSLF